MDNSEPAGSAEKLQLGTALNRPPFAPGRRRSVKSPSTAKDANARPAVRLTISKVPTGRKRGGREEPRYLVSEVAKTAETSHGSRGSLIGRRVDPTLAACELRLGLNVEGLRHTAVESAESPLGCPPTAPRALSLFDSPLLRLAWLRPRPGAGCQRGRPLCEAAILTVRRHPLFTLPAIGIAAYLPTQIGTFLATGYLPTPACADYPAGSHRPLAPHTRRLASGEQTAAA